MARPTRQTVDYFPHFADASERKTLTILEGKFGNSGYAFWFKLLEKLASTPGHFIDCRNGQNWEYLLVKTRTYEEEAREILDLAASLNAIDKDLWEQSVIWSQNLVNNVADVYRNRRKPLPEKPILTVTSPFYTLPTPDNHLITPEPTPCLHPITASIVPPPKTEAKCTLYPPPESKVKYSKVKYSKVRTTITTDADENFANITTCYEGNIGILTPLVADQLKDITQEYPPGWFEEAVKEAVSANVRNLKYITAILKRWKVDGFKVNKKSKRTGGQSGEQESNPNQRNREGHRRLPTDEERRDSIGAPLR